MKKRKKLKISTKNKSYGVMDSPFYKLKSKKKLAGLLCISVNDLSILKNDEGNYSVFDQLSKKGKSRK
ncbi:RNA-directed DNA polymerase, partial [Salmonella enterica]|nr:RNA-directed DNA polymerase [Salmonella enterica]